MAFFRSKIRLTASSENDRGSSEQLLESTGITALWRYLSNGS